MGSAGQHGNACFVAFHMILFSNVNVDKAQVILVHERGDKDFCQFTQVAT